MAFKLFDALSNSEPVLYTSLANFRNSVTPLLIAIAARFPSATVHELIDVRDLSKDPDTSLVDELKFKFSFARVLTAC